VFLRIPDGADIVNPPEDNHFISVFVYHSRSKTLHVDDTFNYFDKPGFLFRNILGAMDGSVAFHPTTFKNGLLPTPEAPVLFVAWLEKVLADWDFDNLVAAHTDTLVGGANKKVNALLEKNRGRFKKLSEENRKRLENKA
jgi:hypothetical protein